MGTLFTVVFAIAAAVWLYAVWQALKVVRAVRPGQRFSLFFPGWPWSVDKAVARYGPQVAAPLQAFQCAFMLFFGLIFVIAALAIAFAGPTTS